MLPNHEVVLDDREKESKHFKDIPLDHRDFCSHGRHCEDILMVNQLWLKGVDSDDCATNLKDDSPNSLQDSPNRGGLELIYWEKQQDNAK